ncbi:MAG: hypothetical protein EH225_11460 [Calditrichaeota bacterium]|nr:NifB/NifX family molybdenum-iron cluster-binding protein [Calditrichota bacterium]RQV99499.1 MAG: hypothetical protein EH225_11460 [Calditrichota bacterium]
MKIAVTALDSHIDAKISPVLERCSHFLIFENHVSDIFQVAGNPYYLQSNGADIFCAQLLIRLGISLIITGSCSKNSINICKAAGIKIICIADETVKTALQNFRRNSYTALKESI